MVIGGDGAFVPYPSHSFVSYLGPQVYMLLLDCRLVPFATSVAPKRPHISLSFCSAERKKDQVCGQREYQVVFERIMRLPPQVDHLVVQIGMPPLRFRVNVVANAELAGIPIAYPRMVFMETVLESKLNPLVALGRAGSMGLGGFVNKFNADAELLDDLVREPLTITFSCFSLIDRIERPLDGQSAQGSSGLLRCRGSLELNSRPSVVEGTQLVH